MFRIDHLGFQYLEQIPVLKDVNLVLDDRSTAIIGQNGAGKTTLVKLLKGLLKPVSGSIYYGGEDISGKTVAMLAGEVGYVFQNPDDQIFKYHVMDEVMFGPLNIGMSREEAEQKSLAALKTVGLQHLAKENPYDLELSERKLVAIASVLAMNTKVLFWTSRPLLRTGKEGTLSGILSSLSEKKEKLCWQFCTIWILWRRALNG